MHVTRGFYKTRTRSRRNPHPWLRVRVSRGTGAGFPGKPQGCPCQTLNQYDPDDNISIRLHVAPGYHHHRQQYNLPTADEVAVILPGADSDNLQIHRRDIIFQKRSRALQTISYESKIYF